MRVLLAVLASAAVLAAAVIAAQGPGGEARTYLERSVPYVGTGAPAGLGYDGSGVTVAVIDTGVDYNHPGLLGWGPGGRVVGGYNLVQPGRPPLDTDGHGTQVAGVIAAGGAAPGVAPGADILAYKVSENGEGVASGLITEAVRRAVDDGADVINISLGVNRTNPQIDRAVGYALERGAVVVVAAGNDGPGPGSIGSPGAARGAITVGATYNNLTSSVVATLEVAGTPYTVIPMVGSELGDGPVSGPLVLGGYGRPGELEDADGAIVLVERGSDTEGELLYFSAKERNAADAGAAAVIVYNNADGIFLGELAPGFAGPGYSPRIPAVSMDRDDGLEAAGAAGAGAVLHLFHNPDHVAHFSSRGPVSPLYIKPELTAPGAYVNTTDAGAGYNYTSGTSYAAPHVSGAAALLLQRDPGLTHWDIRSLLMTTAAPASDSRGEGFPASDAGSGRLDIAAAFGARLVITPPSFVAVATSADPVAEQLFSLRFLGGGGDGLEVSLDGPGPGFSHDVRGDVLAVRLDASGLEYGAHEGRLLISHSGTKYSVPFIMHHTRGTVSAGLDGDVIRFEVDHPDGWSYARVAADGAGRTLTASAVPGSPASVTAPGDGEYLVEARIRGPGGTSSAYDVLTVGSLGRPAEWGPSDVPARQLAAAAAVALVTVALGAASGRRAPRQ